MLIWIAVGVVIQAFYVAVFSPERDVVEAADCEGGLGVGGGDEAFLWCWD